MKENKGQVNTAVCLAKVIEDEVIKQIPRMCDYHFYDVQPDPNHAWFLCRLGLHNRRDHDREGQAVANIVGVYIGYGMYTVNLVRVEIDMEQMDAAGHFMPSGLNVWEGRKKHFDLLGLHCYRGLKGW